MRHFLPSALANLFRPALQIDVAVNAPAAGTIKEFLVNEDDTVTVGQDLLKMELGDAPEGASKDLKAKDQVKGPASDKQETASQPDGGKEKEKKQPEPKKEEKPAPAPKESQKQSEPKKDSKPNEESAYGNREERRVSQETQKAARSH
jgi:2-oxoglutarate dehydrogenase E2 component (dihydrolipoamide succinyltransferase)